MADAALSQTNFLGGEWSLRMQGRFDRPDYRTALNVCLNAFPTETGAWTRRPGSQFAATTRGGAAGKLIKNDFQAAAPYTMEFTDGFLRFFNGVSLVTTNDDKVIFAISAANPAVVQITTAATWSTSDSAIFKLMGAGCPRLQNRTVKLTKVDTMHFAIADAVTGAAIDGATIGTPAAGATIGRVLEIGTVYAGGIWSSLRAVQTMNVVANQTLLSTFLLQPATPPYVVTVVTAPTSSLYATFAINKAVLLDGPYLDPNTDLLTANGYTGTLTITAATANFGGFLASDVGRLIRMLCEPPLFNGSVNYHAAEFVTYPTLGQGGPYWIALKATSAIPGTDATAWAPAPPDQSTTLRWAWGTIVSIAAGNIANVTLSVGFIAYNAGGVAQLPTVQSWRLGVFSDRTGWPTCGTFHEGRLWLSGAIANRIDSSVANDPFNFAPTTTGGVVLPSSAISYTFNAPDVNPIYWMVPDLQGIICGTKAGEWLVQSPATGPLAPTNIAARRVTKVKGANIEPVRTEHTLLFAQAFGRKVMEYFADIYSGKFSGPHASYTWKHLTAGGIDEIAYQQELIPTLWLRVKGALRSAVYKRDTLTTAQGPTISAGARHTLGSGRSVESICAGPSVGGSYDSLSMITNDPATNVRHVEVMTDLLDEGAASSSAWFLDDAVRPTSTVSSNVPIPVTAPYGGMTLNGLWHLNGKTVQVWAGGVDCGNRGDNLTTFTDFVVTNGAVFVPYGDGVSAGSGAGLFTPAFAAAAAAAGTIVVGFSYNSDGQIVRAATPQESGARTGPALAKTRRVDKYGLQVENTAGLAIGTDFAKLYPVQFKDAGGTILLPNVTFTGITRDSLRSDYDYDNMICWRVARPYPASVVALAGFLSTQDA